MITVTAAEPGRDGTVTYTLADGDLTLGYASIRLVGPPKFGQSNREYWRERSGDLVTSDDIAAWDAAITAYCRESSRLEALVAELDSYLPAAVKNQALQADGPIGPGTLKGFHAKVAEVFRLGMSVGWDRHAEAGS